MQKKFRGEWLEKNPSASPSDRAATENVIKELAVVDHTADPNRATKHVHAGEAKGQKQGVDPRTYDFKKDKYKNVETGKDPHIDYE